MKNPRISVGLLSSTITNVREIPLSICCRAVLRRYPLSSSLPQSKAPLLCSRVRVSIFSDIGRTLVSFLDHTKKLSVGDQIENQRIRTELNKALWAFFNGFDLLFTPTMPTEAFEANGPPPAEIDGHPIPLLLAVAFTYPFNLSGHPAATVRVGLTETGLPAGLQIIGPRHRDDLVLQAAYAYEQLCPWNDHWPDSS